MQTPPKAPTSPLPSNFKWSYRGVIRVLHSLLTLYSRPRDLNTVVLKGKKSGDPTVLASGNASGTTGRVRPALLACLAPARISRELPNHESRALPRAHAR